MALLFAGGLLLEAGPVGAVPARRLEGPLPPASAGAESCTAPIQRSRGGPGRRPGATVVPVTIRLEVLNAAGKFVGASSDYTTAMVEGDDVTLRATVTNLSLYDVGSIVIRHRFTPSEDGPILEGIGDVQGAELSERSQTFHITEIESDSSVAFTFRLLLTGALDEELSESQIRLESFEVLGSERRHPQRLPESSRDQSRQSLERLGIGTTDVACFIGSSIRERQGGQGGEGPISVQKSTNVTEVQPGGTIVYTITVTNRGNETLRDVLIDDRFSSSHLRVSDTGGGEKLASGLQWFIEELSPGERFVARYRAEADMSLRNGDHIPNTTLVVSSQLRDTSTTKRSASVTVPVLQKMPRTGVELSWLLVPLEILLGCLVAFLLFRTGLSIALWQGRKIE